MWALAFFLVAVAGFVLGVYAGVTGAGWGWLAIGGACVALAGFWYVVRD